MKRDKNAEWKDRFRLPLIRQMLVAARDPSRGLISSNVSGTFQLHAWDVPTGRLTQLTSGRTGVLTGVLAPDGAFVYYHQDDHGNELGHFVRVSFDGGAPESLTPTLPAYPTFGFAASAVGNRIGFITAGEGGYRVYVVDVTADNRLGVARCIFVSTRFLLAPVLSFDGEIVVVARNTDGRSRRCQLVALDVTTGSTLGELGGPDTDLSPVVFAPRPGDSRLVANCNETGVQRPLLWDIAAGKRTDLSMVDLDGDVEVVDWSPDSLALLLVHVRAAVQSLHVHDIAGGEQTRLGHSAGTYHQACFGPDGCVWSVWEDSTHPPQVVSLDARTGEKRRGTLLPATHTPPCRPWKSVSFSSSDGQRVQGWLGLPDGDGPFPTILHLHGGPEFAMTELFYPSGQMWLDSGFAFLTVNYRGSTTFGREFLERIWGNVGYWEVEDMVAARSWLVSEHVSDPAMIFVTGSSYGGYLTLQALGTKPTLWAGGMAAIAVADWVIAQEDTTATLRGLRTARFGGTPDEYPERYAKSSPLTYASDVGAPVLIIQGRNDTRTPPRSVVVYEERMKALGKDINVHWFDAGHGSLVVEQTIEQHELMLEFARRVTEIHSVD